MILLAQPSSHAVALGRSGRWILFCHNPAPESKNLSSEKHNVRPFQLVVTGSRLATATHACNSDWLAPWIL